MKKSALEIHDVLDLRKAVLIILITFLTVTATERPNYVFVNYALLLNSAVSIGYQRIVTPKHALGVLLHYQGLWNTNPQSLSAFLNYNYYSKESFHGFWLSPAVGIETSKAGNNIPILAGIGYHWLTPIGISLGINFAPGAFIVYQNKLADEFRFAFLGIADIGFAF